jgi:hypothetical protein
MTTEADYPVLAGWHLPRRIVPWRSSEIRLSDLVACICPLRYMADMAADNLARISSADTLVRNAI